MSDVRIAVLGLGVIGRGIADNLLRAGVDVRVWNRGPERTAGFDPTRVRPTAAEAARDADLVLVAVTDDAAVTDLLIGDGGVLAACTPGAVIVDHATIAASTDTMLAEHAAGHGLGYVDAPVTGGAEAAASGTLRFLCGGEDAVVARVAEGLRAAGTVVHLGPLGSGQRTKAVNDIILAANLLGVAEGIAFARAAGIDLDRMLEAIGGGAAASWVLTNRARFMIDGEFPPAGRMALHHKDLGIALREAEALGLDLTATRLVHRLEGDLIAAGSADEDVSALIRAVEPRRTTSGGSR